MKRALRLILQTFVYSAAFGAIAADNAAPRYIKPEHRFVLSAWFQDHKSFRIATDQDCKSQEQMKQIRLGFGGMWKAAPDYHPYYAVGDFNHDGVEDFALGVIGQKPTEFSVAIFHGPFNGNELKPTPHIIGSYPLHEALVFGPPRPAPHFLIVGPFEAEGSALIWRKDHYSVEYVPPK